MSLYEMIGYWQQMGIYDILLPFVLIFTISFAVLQKIKLFGPKSKNINAVIALVIAFFFLNNPYLVFILQKFLPNISIFLVIFLMFLLLLGVFVGPNKFKESMVGLAFFVALGAVILALFSDIFYPGPSGMLGGGVLDLYYSIDPGTRFFLWLVVLTAIFVMFIMKDDNNDGFLKNVAKGIEQLGENRGRG